MFHWYHFDRTFPIAILHQFDDVLHWNFEVTPLWSCDMAFLRFFGFLPSVFKQTMFQWYDFDGTVLRAILHQIDGGLHRNFKVTPVWS